MSGPVDDTGLLITWDAAEVRAETPGPDAWAGPVLVRDGDAVRHHPDLRRALDDDPALVLRYDQRLELHGALDDGFEVQDWPFGTLARFDPASWAGTHRDLITGESDWTVRVFGEPVPVDLWELPCAAPPSPSPGGVLCALESDEGAARLERDRYGAVWAVFEGVEEWYLGIDACFDAHDALYELLYDEGRVRVTRVRSALSDRAGLAALVRAMMADDLFQVDLTATAEVTPDWRGTVAELLLPPD